MDPFTWAAIGSTAISTIAGFLGSKKAETAAKRQAQEQALAEGRLTEERVYELQQQERDLFGETLARYTGSGVRVADPSLTGANIQAPEVPTAPTTPDLPTRKKGGRKAAIEQYLKSVQTAPEMAPGRVRGGGSVGAVLQEQAKTFARERAITREVGASNVAQTLLAGRSLADKYRYQGYANVASGISNMFLMGSKG